MARRHWWQRMRGWEVGRSMVCVCVCMYMCVVCVFVYVCVYVVFGVVSPPKKNASDQAQS